MKKYAGFTPIFIGGHGAGRAVHVFERSKELFENILKNYRSNYHLTTLFRQIMLLNSDASRGTGLNRAGDIRSISSGNVSMEYTIFDGVVLINYIKVIKNQTAESIGLYAVNKVKSRNKWEISDRTSLHFDRNQKWKSGSDQAYYGAIGGRFDSKEDAGEKIAEHIIGAYKKADLITSHDVGDEYSLFWAQKGMHKSAEAAQSVASLMQQSSKNKLNVNWLVHAEGTDTFKNAAKLLKSSPLASAKQRAQNPNAGKIETTQNVYFSNPNTSSEKTLEKLCDEAGLNFVGLNTSNRDLRRFSTFKNAGMEVGKTMSMAAATGASVASVGMALKTMGATGAEKVILNGVDAAITGNYLQVAAAVVASGFIAVGVSTKSKALAAGIHCTFGKGNQQWYTEDVDLFA